MSNDAHNNKSFVFTVDLNERVPTIKITMPDNTFHYLVGYYIDGKPCFTSLNSDKLIQAIKDDKRIGRLIWHISHL